MGRHVNLASSRHCDNIELIEVVAGELDLIGKAADEEGRTLGFFAFCLGASISTATTAMTMSGRSETVVAALTALTAGDVSAGDVTAGAVTAGDVTAGAVTAESVFAGNVSAGEVFAGDVDAGEVQAGDVTACRSRTCRSW